MVNILTLKEKKNIVKKVLEGYQGITISEVISFVKSNMGNLTK